MVDENSNGSYTLCCIEWLKKYFRDFEFKGFIKHALKLKKVKFNIS